MKLIPTILSGLLTLTLLSGCKSKSPIKNFDITVGGNAVTAVAETIDEFSLLLTGTFNIVVKDQNYGKLFAEASTDTTPFRFGATVDFDAFVDENWRGFEPTTTLPNGDPLPGWITPYELIAVDIPNFNDSFDLTFYVGPNKPSYLGLAIELELFDDAYPAGLSIVQNIRKGGAIVGSVVLYGPTFDDNNNVVQHGGIFLVATFDQDKPGHLGLGSGLELEKFSFEGRDAAEYRDDKRKQKELMKKVKEALKKFNEKIKD